MRRPPHTAVTTSSGVPPSLGRWARWLIGFGCWTAVGLLFAAQIYLDQAYLGKPIGWGSALAVALSDWYAWGLLSLPIFSLVRRFPFERSRWARSLLVHAPASLVLTVSKLMLGAVFMQAALPGRNISMIHIQMVFLTYWVIVGVGHGLIYYRRFKDREARALRLESQLAQTHLRLLKMQLHPHFLFNTLHAVTTLMHRDVAAAEKMLTRLSDLLRMTLEKSDTQEVTLKEEMDLLRIYLEIQETRFQDRLQVEIDIDPEVLDALVPSMILQPLVENAVRHGISEKRSGGRIGISALRNNGELQLAVSDDGPGLTGQPDPKEGTGLANTRARLEQLWGSKGRLDLLERKTGGLEARLTVPFRAQGHPGEEPS